MDTYLLRNESDSDYEGEGRDKPRCALFKRVKWTKTENHKPVQRYTRLQRPHRTMSRVICDVQGTEHGRQAWHHGRSCFTKAESSDVRLFSKPVPAATCRSGDA